MEKPQKQYAKLKKKSQTLNINAFSVFALKIALIIALT